MGNSALPAKILFLGLDNAGKTSVISFFESKGKLESSEEPTVGFKMKDIKYKGVGFKIWDVAGKESVRSLWKHYYPDKDAVVFVIDASDKGRVDEALQQLKHVLGEPELAKCILLVLANKAEVHGAIEVNDLKSKIEPMVDKQRAWNVYSSTTKSQGKDLTMTAFEWLSSEIKKRRKAEAAKEKK